MVAALPAPNVLLAAINAVANIALLVAIGQGVAIACTSVLSLVQGIKYFNFIALAALATKVAIIDSILLQRATSTYLDNGPQQNVMIGSTSLRNFPLTGLVENGTVFSTTQQFGLVVNYWHGAGEVMPNDAGYFQGCDGTCQTSFEGIGFFFECSGNSTPTDYGANPVNGTSLPVFNMDFEMSWANATKNYASVIFNGLAYQAANSAGSCAGNLIEITCELRPALVDIGITVFNSNTGGSSASPSNGGVELGWPMIDLSYVLGAWNQTSNNQINSNIVQSILNITEDGTVSDSTLGGIQIALQQYLGSSANITYVNGQWELQQSGWSASSDAANNYEVVAPGTCNYIYGTQPLDIDIANSVNQLTYMMNTKFADIDGIDSHTEPISALQTSYGVHYQTHFGYMWGAFVSMVCVLLVLPTYWGFWELGRSVTLGPFEIANAFRAPTLDNVVASNGGVDDLLREVGHKRVQYGETPEGRLAMAEPEVVRRVGAL